MLKNHQRNIRKSTFFTVIYFPYNLMIRYMQTRHHYLYKTVLMTHQLTIGSERSFSCSIMTNKFENMLSCTKLTTMEKIHF